MLEKGSAEWQLRVLGNDQTWRSNEVRGTRSHDPEGNPVIVISSRDITERKRAEQALLDAQDELRSRLEQQHAVADFGQRALRATEILPLLEESAAIVASTLKVEFSGVSELQDNGKKLRIQAAVGWPAGGLIDAVPKILTRVTHWPPISRSSSRISVTRRDLSVCRAVRSVAFCQVSPW